MINEELFQDFIANRNELGRPMTPTAVKRLRMKLDRLEKKGYCPNLTMERAIEYGWLGVWEKDECRKQVGFIEKHTNRDWATKTQSVPFVELHTNRKWREGL